MIVSRCRLEPIMRTRVGLLLGIFSQEAGEILPDSGSWFSSDCRAVRSHYNGHRLTVS